MKKTVPLLFCLMLIYASCNPVTPPPPHTAAPTAPQKTHSPLYMGYYRSWHDSYGTPGAGERECLASKMSDVPPEVDVVFVFHAETQENSPFWDKLRDEYVPKLNRQGTRVVRTIGMVDVDGRRGFSDPDIFEYEKNPEGWKKLAEKIVAEYVDKCNLDGLDIDFEDHDRDPMWNEKRSPDTGKKSNTGKKMTWVDVKPQAIAVITEIGRILHGKNKLLILDTTRELDKVPDNKAADGGELDPEVYKNLVADYKAADDIFKKTVNSYDFVLRQTYYKDMYKTGFDCYKKYLPKEKYLTGFSFYEENTKAPWNNVPKKSIVADEKTNKPKDITVEDLMQNQDFKDCTACKMAEFVAEQGYGGLFSYAIERDGIAEGNNEKFFYDCPSVPENQKGYTSQYLFSKALKKLMQQNYKNQ